MKEIRSEVKKPIQGFYNKAMDNLLRRVFELMLAGGALSQSENEVRSTNAKHQFENLSKTNDEKSNRDRRMENDSIFERKWTNNRTGFKNFHEISSYLDGF